jgi:hypothetical protein
MKVSQSGFDKTLAPIKKKIIQIKMINQKNEWEDSAEWSEENLSVFKESFKNGGNRYRVIEETITRKVIN